MISTDTLQFLYELSQNNNRDWFEKNKPRYEKTVKKPFEQMVDALILRLRAFEPEFNITAKDCIFRINRDTRFSKDKTPYKTHLAAVFTSRGRKSFTDPGYYLHLEFGTLSLGGGAYFLEKEGLQKVRTAIAQDPDTFRAIMEHPNFKAKYGEIKGEKNKILPAEFKEAAMKEPLLYNKQFYFMADLDPELATKADFLDFATEYFQAAKEVNQFFKAAVLRGTT